MKNRIIALVSVLILLMLLVLVEHKQLYASGIALVSSVFGQVGAVNIPVTTTDISTPGNPAGGKTTWYTKGGLLCSLNPSGGENCTGAGGGGSGGGITVYSATGLTVTANTYFLPLGGGALPSTTEANVQVRSPVASTITNMFVQLSAPLGSGNAGVFTFDKAGSPQSVTCTISGVSATACDDATHSFSVSQGDLLDIELVTTGTIVATPNILITAQFGNITQTGTVNTGVNRNLAFYPASGSAVGDSGIVAANVAIVGATGVLASSYVANSESTTSTGFTQLTTHDTVTFTLGATTNVPVTYMAYMSPTTGTGQSCVTQYNIDASDVTATALFAGLNAANSDPISNEYKVSLGSGSHTIFVEYKVTGNGCNWFNRLLSIQAAP